MGQPQNFAEALSWFYKAAAQGNDQAQENIGYIFEHGTGVPVDYAKARALFEQAAAQGNGDAENQLGWMYQYGQGVQKDNARALTWYQLSAHRGDVAGQNNVADFTSYLEEEGDYQNATLAVHDPAADEAQRWANIQDLRHRIDAAEADAAYQDGLVSQLEGMNKGKTDGVSRVFKAIGDAGSVKYRVLAENDRAAAATLRGQLARIEGPSQFSLQEPNP